MRKILLAAILPLLMLSSGCASILEGTSQTVSFDSNPQQADCTLTREGRVISTFTTPSGVVIEKSKHDIDVKCAKEGYQDATNVLTSDVESATFGNILLGGVVGWAIDSASGADNRYSDQITVTLVPETGTPRTGSVPMADKMPAAPSGDGDYGVLLASYSSDANARNGWPGYRDRYTGLMQASPYTRPVEDGEGGTRYNLYGAGLTRTAADSVCAEAAAEGAFCEVVAL